MNGVIGAVSHTLQTVLRFVYHDSLPFYYSNPPDIRTSASVSLIVKLWEGWLGRRGLMSIVTEIVSGHLIILKTNSVQNCQAKVQVQVQSLKSKSKVKSKVFKSKRTWTLLTVLS